VHVRLGEEPDTTPPRLAVLPEEQKRLKVSTRIRVRLLVGLGCAALLISSTFMFPLRLRTEQRVRSLAVVPFRVAGPASDGYLSEGSAEGLSFRLTQIRGLRVIAPQVAGRLRHVSDPHEVGQRLGVDGVITRDLRTEGGRLRASVQLIATRDGTVLWADDSLDEGLGNPVESVRRLTDTIVSGVRIGITKERDPLLKTGSSAHRGTRKKHPEAGPKRLR
jgi:TolB-like protein